MPKNKSNKKKNRNKNNKPNNKQSAPNTVEETSTTDEVNTVNDDPSVNNSIEGGVSPSPTTLAEQALSSTSTANPAVVIVVAGENQSTDNDDGVTSRDDGEEESVAEPVVHSKTTTEEVSVTVSSEGEGEAVESVEEKTSQNDSNTIPTAPTSTIKVLVDDDYIGDDCIAEEKETEEGILEEEATENTEQTSPTTPTADLSRTTPVSPQQIKTLNDGKDETTSTTIAGSASVGQDIELKVSNTETEVKTPSTEPTTSPTEITKTPTEASSETPETSSKASTSAEDRDIERKESTPTKEGVDVVLDEQQSPRLNDAFNDAEIYELESDNRVVSVRKLEDFVRESKMVLPEDIISKDWLILNVVSREIPTF